MNARLLPYAALMLFGIGWGASIPLSKIAVSAGHMPLGLIFWQFVIGVVLLGAMIVARGSFPRITGWFPSAVCAYCVYWDDITELCILFCGCACAGLCLGHLYCGSAHVCLPDRDCHWK